MIYTRLKKRKEFFSSTFLLSLPTIYSDNSFLFILFPGSDLTSPQLQLQPKPPLPNTFPFPIPFLFFDLVIVSLKPVINGFKSHCLDHYTMEAYFGVPPGNTITE